MPLRLSTVLAGESRSWSLTASPTRIGRSSKSEIQIADGTVSKEHAEIVRRGEDWLVRDLGSRNGTRVNGQEAGEPTTLRAGDLLEVGHVTLRVESEGAEAVTMLHAAGGLSSSIKMRVADVLQRGPTATGDQGHLVHLLAEAGQLLVLPRPLRETCEEILRLVDKAVPANRLVVLIREKADADPVQVAARRGRGAKGAGVSASEPLALSRTILQMVLGENTAVITRDAASDPRFMAQQSVIAQAIHSAMAVPLYDNERVLGLLYVDSTSPLVTYGSEELELLTLLANMAAVKITNGRLLEAEQARQRMAQELATATRIQQALLPTPPADLPGWRWNARIETCYEVGGDLYDFHRREDGALVFLVGDISGKGMGAALLMSSVLASARVLYDDCADPLTFVRRLNGVVYRTSDARSFVTLFVGYLDPGTGVMRYVNAGHPEPHIVCGDVLRTLEATGIPVGMLPEFPYTMGTITLAPGETLALFSDGIPEAQRGEEFYDMDRLAVDFKALANESDLERLGDGLIARIDEFMAGSHRTDDVTLVLARRE